MVNRTAIVTGGSAGIGLAISERLAAGGARVAILARTLDTAESAAERIRTAGGDARAWSVDVTDRARVLDAVADVRARLGPPTILVNNAGAGAFGPFLEITREQWDAQLALNLTSAFDCCQAVVPDMLTAGWGRIVNISSSSVHSGVPRMTHYVAAKSGMVGLTKALALELAPHGITVNTIPPGFVETPLLQLHAAQGKYDLDEQIARTPVGRPGRPEDIAAACAFLVSDEAGYITGQVIGVNGGRNT
jgi:2-hydroxycyclohexanecarboxyl-CoA dehydrogenase